MHPRITVDGVDFSLSSAGLVSDRWGGVEGHTFKPPAKLKGFEREQYHIDRIVGPASTWRRPRLVVIEARPRGRYPAPTLVEGRHSLLRAYWTFGACPAVQPSAMSLKVLGTGSGTADKEQMVAAVYEATGTVMGHDEADAFVAYCLGLHLLGVEHPLLPWDRANQLKTLELFKLPTYLERYL